MQERGGNIVDDDVPRVCGVLAVTRAFGNNTIKSTVNAEPELSEHAITPDLEYVVIASDGVWDVLSNEDVVRSQLEVPAIESPDSQTCSLKHGP